jgi:V8-like Glu-specific endopeptidase
MNAFYTVPTKPGSSGAAIFNNRGQIVGIIHSAPADFENLAIASSLEQVKMFVYENVNVVVTF